MYFWGTWLRWSAEWLTRLPHAAMRAGNFVEHPMCISVPRPRSPRRTTDEVWDGDGVGHSHFHAPPTNF